jgi:hypothetical protein
MEVDPQQNKGRLSLALISPQVYLVRTRLQE